MSTPQLPNNINHLHQQFRYKGGLSLKYRRECIGMLPEIFRLEVYKKKGFATIVEYASILAGISKKQTYLTLNLEERLKDKPGLHQALSKGEVSINKLARIVSIATAENEQELVEKVKLLPQKALETYVRDHARSKAKCALQINTQQAEIQDGLFKSKNADEHLRAQTFDMPLNLAEDVETELLELQNKGINVNDLLREFLSQRKENLAKEKEELAEEVYAKKEQQKQNSGKHTASRYVPAKIRQHIRQEHGTKCTIQTCNKPSQQIHHTQRFSLSHNHDPHYLAPLCKEHHQIAHAIDQKYQQKRLL